MHRIKVFLTILILYEFMVLTILQIPSYCIYIFNSNFCAQIHFKYFLLCVMLPAMTGLVFWWAPEVSRLFCKNKCQCEPENNNILSKQNLERLLTAIITMGLEKFLEYRTKNKKKTKRN